MKRSAFREIKSTFGRYFAIMAIIALGVGFFSGVRITTKAMVHTVDGFLDEHQFYDYRLLSTVGWDEEDAEYFGSQPDVRAAEGAYSMDVIFNYNGGRENVLKTHSVTRAVNELEVVEGRMPSSPDECVVDAAKRGYPEIGSKVKMSSENDEGTFSSLAYREYTVVGAVYSPCYVNFERGSTSIGNGDVAGFIYLLPESFLSDSYSEIFVRFDQDNEIYSDDYRDYMKPRTEEWNSLASERARERCERLYGDKASMLSPEAYVLGRETNIGYACFENDSEIVAQVARVFPVFFILVAALVCMTTMSRMVEEQRTQIGVFKALGYSDASIMGRFMFYSGSAAVTGCILGYCIGIVLFPGVIWMTYKLMYISLPMRYVFDLRLALTAVAVSLLCSVGTTWAACRHELSETAAGLMRPKAPKAGKRVLLENIPFIWKRMKFLHKVSVRNIFRYKKRFFMMIVGISGCTALLLTGFGLKDSIAGFADMQYDEIQTADAQLSFRAEDNGEIPEKLSDLIAENTSGSVRLYQGSWDLLYGEKVKGITLVAPESYDGIEDFMNFHTVNGDALEYPAEGEAVVSNSIRDRYDVSAGDTITLRDDEMRELRLTVTGIFENHVYNYIFISHDTLNSQLGTDIPFNGAYLNFPDGSDEHVLSAAIAKDRNVVSLVLFSELKTRMSKMMNSLNYIVLVVILSAAGLAFIVIYNLTNINITERIREIATIKVLGFFMSETSAYVLRENLALTAFGTAAGLGLGVLLHRFVMEQIVVDLVSFRIHIAPLSFLWSILLTFAFNFIVDLFMERKLEAINMAESLKSVE